MIGREPVDHDLLHDLLTGADKPGRYIGGEVNSVVKPGPVRARLALCFPDVYEVAESHIGLKILYEIVNAVPDLAAERVYALWPDLEARARAAKVPLWSLETRRPLAAFDVVGFTLQYELAYPTIVAMLEHGGVPVRTRDRGQDDPIVIAGGAGTYNAEPVADFFDAMLLGDGEEAVIEILDTVARARARGAPRAEILDELGRLPGMYVPSHFEIAYDGLRVTAMRALRPAARSRHDTPRVPRRVVRDLDAAPYPVRPIVPFVQPVHERVAVEIQRGCSQGCRFCQPGMVTRPTRQRRPGTVLGLVHAGLTASGCDEVGLLSLSAGDYGPINQVVAALLDRGRKEQVSVSLPSMRTETMTPELATELAAGRRGGFTLAPEAATERLRRVINKTNSEADLLAAVRATMQAGWRSLKLYFMIGLPTESEEDVDAILRLSKRVLDEARAIRGDATVSVGISTFVPKPHTPFQWERQLDIDETLAKQGRLRDGLRRRRIGFRYHSAEQSFIEGVLSRGDRRLADAVEAAARAGSRLDAWTEHHDHRRWMKALDEALAPHGIAAADYLGPRELDALLPWDHLDAGILKKFLRADRARALRGDTLDDCAFSDRCHACGGCDLGDPYLARDPVTGSRRVRLEPVVFAPSAPQEAASAARTEPGPGAPAAAGITIPESHPAGAATAGRAEPRTLFRPPKSGPPVARSRVRFRLAKAGRCMHLSHLELMSQVLRAIRQSQLPVLYTEGHVPRPRVGFSPASPTGIESRAEYFEADCNGFPDPATYAAKIDRLLPDGLAVLEAVEIAWATPALNELLAATSYAVELPAGSEPEAVRQAIRDLSSAEAYPVRVLRKGKPRIIDAKPCVEDVALEGGALALSIAFSREGTLKIGEALALLLGPAVAPRARITKTALRLTDVLLPHAQRPPLAADTRAIDLTDLGERRTPMERPAAARGAPYAE